VKTPAAVFPVPPFLEDMSWGAESEPRKNLGDPEAAAWRRAVRSLGTGRFESAWS
jgi:hypothetical protein